MDRINKNINLNQYNMSFAGIKKDASQMNDKEIAMNKLVTNCKNALYDFTDESVPENNDFQRIYVDFKIPDTQYRALMAVESDKSNPNTQRCLLVGVRHQNRDRLFSNYLLSGNKQEILQYLKDDSNKSDILDSIENLSNSADDYYSTL